MPHGSRYRVPLRRRREQKTDYQARKGFVVSHKPRLVARSSLKNTVAQIIVAKPIGDMVLASAHSSELVKKYGWKGATGNIPAAYLTGLLCGLKAKQKSVSEAILDLGLVSPTKGSKVFSTMAGVVDAGVKIPHNPEKISRSRIFGYHIVEYAESLGGADEYSPKFSISLAKGLAPEKLSDHFVEIRNSILTAYGMPLPKVEPRPAKVKKPEPKKPEAKPVKTETKVEVKPEVKKPEAKPAKAEKVATVEKKAEAKPEAETKKPEVAEVKKPEKTSAKPAKKPKAAAKTEAKEPEAEKAETKPAAKKAAAKPKAEKKAEPKKKSEAKTAKSGGKKE